MNIGKDPDNWIPVRQKCFDSGILGGNLVREQHYNAYNQILIHYFSGLDVILNDNNYLIRNTYAWIELR